MTVSSNTPLDHEQAAAGCIGASAAAGGVSAGVVDPAAIVSVCA